MRNIFIIAERECFRQKSEVREDFSRNTVAIICVRCAHLVAHVLIYLETIYLLLIQPFMTNVYEGRIILVMTKVYEGRIILFMTNVYEGRIILFMTNVYEGRIILGNCRYIEVIYGGEIATKDAIRDSIEFLFKWLYSQIVKRQPSASKCQTLISSQTFTFILRRKMIGI